MMQKKKKEYLCPEFSWVRYSMRDILTGSVEDLGEYIDTPGDWNDPYLPPEDDFNW